MSIRTVAAVLLWVPAAGCATAGATLGSGVGDALVDRPPYYAGASPDEVRVHASPIGHLPVAYQRGASHPDIFDPERSPALHRLLADMTAYLQTLGATSPMTGEGLVAPPATGAPPDVRFGCESDSGVPGDDCVERGDSALGRGPQYVVLSVGRPSTDWVTWLGRTMELHGVERTLFVTLEVGQYWTRQRGLRGTKEVLLGTAHTADVPWLTSLETPVSVVQLTGALLGPDGKAVRIGAEGLLAQRTPLAISALGAQRIVTDEDVERLAVATRDDLPGAPLVWHVGLRELVRGLLGGRADGTP